MKVLGIHQKKIKKYQVGSSGSGGEADLIGGRRRRRSIEVGVKSWSVHVGRRVVPGLPTTMARTG